MLYTTYISNMRNIPKGAKIVLITRWAPKSLDLSKFDDAKWEPILAPADSLLAQYKNGAMSKVEMLNKYKEFLENNIMANELILSLVQQIKQDKDVFLVCYEKDVFDCHRSVLAKYIADKYNIPWMEF